MNTPNGAMNGDGAADIQRLREIVAHLESERHKDQQRLKEITAERDEYLQALYRWSRSQVTEEQLKRWTNEMPEGDSFERVMQVLGINQKS